MAKRPNLEVLTSTMLWLSIKGRPSGLSPHSPSLDFTSGAHCEGAVLLGNLIPLLPSHSCTRFLKNQRALLLAFRDSDSTRRELSIDATFDMFASLVLELSLFLWRKALSDEFWHNSGLGAHNLSFPGSPSDPRRPLPRPDVSCHSSQRFFANALPFPHPPARTRIFSRTEAPNLS
ncbi:hypothetical protein PISMIDRAFT_17027 [Pisolithus microcarpus 441]|uniref:Uncharacterized protein n=1 Tax=Pisolithus microcarpus 441 TaxID=765257 RepID=A0A0C9YX63_9AGAM|nr:hypothetical protein PISMIDRAFT_17027 [Pisolithus microcarpus 441]